MNVIATGQTLGARVEGLDLAARLLPGQVDQLVQALGTYGVLEFPQQSLSARNLRDFSANFGDLWVSPGGRAQAPGLPEVMILSNIVVDGKPVGLADAGQSWHTDMSYMRMVAYTNVLYGTKIPRRDGRALGATQFRNMYAAYEGLPDDLKRSVEGRTGRHDFEKFWETMRKENGIRAPLTEEERRKRPPVSQPLVLVHPVTRAKVLYANPGYLTAVDGLPPAESEDIIEALFEHQMRDEYLYEFTWSEHSVLMWDNLCTIHTAVPDYRRDEHRYIERCQVMATRYYGPGGVLDPII